MVARIHRRTVQKDLNYLHNYDGMITHLEPDILEGGVKWTLESIPVNKASVGDGIPAELFQILKDAAGLPSSPLAFFIVILPKAHFTSPSRMSGSR